MNDYPIKSYSPQIYSISTLSLHEAVALNQRFTLDDYYNEIFELLDREILPRAQLSSFVYSIQLYDGLFEKMIEYTHDENIINDYLEEGVNPSKLQCMFAFATGELRLWEDDRYYVLASLPRKNFLALELLYDASGIDAIFSKEEHPLEKYVVGLIDIDDVDSYVAQFGMVIPNNVVDKASFALKQVANYSRVNLSEPAPKLPDHINSLKELILLLLQISDQELLRSYGYHGFYITRGDYIFNLMETINGEGFFLLDDELKFGTLNNHVTIDPLDLHSSFVPSKSRYLWSDYTRSIPLESTGKNLVPLPTPGETTTEGDSIVFYHPTSKTQYYSLKQITRLPDILNSIEGEIVTPLIWVIKLGLMQNSNRNSLIEYHRKRMRGNKLCSLTLKLLFYASMYARGWAGLGHPLPTGEPNVNGVITDVRCKALLTRVRDALLELDLGDLSVIDYENGVLGERAMRLVTLISMIIDGEPTIRGGSLLTSSSYYYSVRLSNRLPNREYNLRPIIDSVNPDLLS